MTNIAKLFKTAERHHVSTADLCIEPEMQMRCEMDHEHIEDLARTIEDILDTHPIKVVNVSYPNGDDIWYIVDGFHRYHAALMKGMKSVNIEYVEGSYLDAKRFAMTANFRNGLDKAKGDVGRAIETIMEDAPDFGYDSKLVVKWLMDMSINKRTAEDSTKEYRASINELRDAKIEDLHNEGMSQRAIAAEVGCSNGYVASYVKPLGAQNAQSAQNEQEVEAEDDMLFDVSQEDVEKARSKAQALSDMTRQQEEARSLLATKVTPNVTSSDHNLSGVEALDAFMKEHKGSMSTTAFQELQQVRSLFN